MLGTSATPVGPVDPLIANDTGADDGDGITREIPSIVVDALPAGERLQYQLKGTNTWLDDLSLGDFSLDGSYTVLVRVAIEDGSVSTDTAEVDFTLDRIVSALSVTLTNSLIIDGRVTVDSAPAFDIANLESGAVAEFSNDGGSTWQAVSELLSLTDGDYVLSFRQIDLAGNVSEPTEPLSFSLSWGVEPSNVEAPIAASDTFTGHDGVGPGLTGSDFGWM